MAPPVDPSLDPLAEFACKRVAIYTVQDQLLRERERAQREMARRDHLRAQIASLEQEAQRVEEDLHLGALRQELLASRLSCRMEEMQHFLDQEPTVRIFTDTSVSHERGTFGGLVIEGGAMTTMSGPLSPPLSLPLCSLLGEALAMCEVVTWAAREWPGNLLEVFSDNGSVIAVAEEFLRAQPGTSKSRVLIYIRDLFERRLGPLRKRFFPCWRTRESTEIRICDALARRRNGLEERRIPWLRLLVLTQGALRGRWTTAAVWALHNYHRACRKGEKIWQDRSPFPPA